MIIFPRDWMQVLDSGSVSESPVLGQEPDDEDGAAGTVAGTSAPNSPKIKMVQRL